MTKTVSGHTQPVFTDTDGSKTTKLHRRVLLTTGIGFFTDAYELFIIGVALALIKTQWHPSTLEISLVSSMALVASAAGAVFFGRIADAHGRRKIYGAEMLLLAAGTVATAFSPNIWWLIILRFVVGFGIGGDYPVSATIMSEYSTKQSRGRMVAMVVSMQAVGLIVGPLVAVALLASGMSQDLAWRLMLALGAVPALFAFYLRRQIQETPHFTRATSGKNTELNDPSVPLEHIKPKVRFSSLLKSAKFLRWLIGTGSAWFLLDFAFYGNAISSPVVLKMLSPHANLMTTTLETLAIFVVAAAPGYALAVWRLDSQGRKSVQAVGFAVMAICFLAIGTVPGITSEVAPFLLLYGISYFFTQYGPNTTTFVYPTELFPVRVRTTGHGLAAAAGKCGAFIGTFLFPVLLASIGLNKTELVVGFVCLTGLAVTLVLLPETKGESLEKISGEIIAARPLIVD